MSSKKYPNLISMDKAAINYIKVSFKLTNSVMAMTGIAILMYCVWMIYVCLREYYKYPFSWFLWACIFTGLIFCSTACIGHVGADKKKNNFLLSLYLGIMLFLTLVESLITADICLNDKWDKDIPKDRTKRFDHFVDYVDDHSNNFKCLGVLIAFSQALSFFLAIVIRSMRSKSHRKYEDEEANLPFLDHQVQPPPLPYAVGHPDPQYYPPPPYTHGYGYAPYVTGSEKGEYVAAAVQAAPKVVY